MAPSHKTQPQHVSQRLHQQGPAPSTRCHAPSKTPAQRGSAPTAPYRASRSVLPMPAPPKPQNPPSPLRSGCSPRSACTRPARARPAPQTPCPPPDTCPAARTAPPAAPSQQAPSRPGAGRACPPPPAQGNCEAGVRVRTGLGCAHVGFVVRGLSCSSWHERKEGWANCLTRQAGARCWGCDIASEWPSTHRLRASSITCTKAPRMPQLLQKETCSLPPRLRPVSGVGDFE